MNCRPFVILTNKHRIALQEYVFEALTQWVEDWCLRSDDPLQVNVSDISMSGETVVNSNRINVLYRISDIWCAVTATPEMINGLVASFLGAPMDLGSRDDGAEWLFDSVLAPALDDLFESLVKKLIPEQHSVGEIDISESLPKETAWKGSGCVVVQINVAGGCLDIVASSRMVGKILAFMNADNRELENGVELEPLIAALENESVTGKVRLGSAEVTVGELMSLQLGDVLALEQDLNMPAVLAINGMDACKVFLGKQNGKTAIRIISAV